MWCPVCGEWLAQEIAQSEARYLAHRLLRHEPSPIQALGGLLFSLLAGYLVKQLVD
jgi:hypothetical protein